MYLSTFQFLRVASQSSLWYCRHVLYFQSYTFSYNINIGWGTNKYINYSKPFAYPCMVILVVFDILVIFEISGTLNINGCSIIKKVKVLYFQSCKRNSNVFWLTCIIGFSGSISNYRSFSNCFNEGVCLVYNSNRNTGSWHHT